MTLNEFVHSEGITYKRELFWGFVRHVLRVRGELDKASWWQYLGMFEARMPMIVEAQ